MDQSEAAEGSREPRWMTMALWSLVVVAFALRLPGAIQAWTNPDEGFYLRFANVPEWEAFVRMTLLTPHPPLFFALHRMLALLGSDVLVLRMLSVVAGALGVHAVGRLTKEVSDARAGLLAAALLCLAPGAIVLSQVARPYALLFALLCYSLVALLVHLRSASRAALWGHGLTMAAALLTHYGALPVAAASGSVLLAHALRDPRGRPELRARLVAEGLLAALTLLLLMFHLRPYVLGTSMQESAQVSWLTPHFVSTPAEIWLGILGVQRFLFGERFEVLAMLSLVAGFALILHGRRWIFSALVAISFSLWILLSALGQYPLGSTRHSFMGNVLTLPLVALPFAWVLARGPWKAVAAVAAAGLVLSFPALPRRLVGADELQTAPSVEYVAPAGALDSQIAFLKRLRDEEHSILMDRQTWNTLAPLWVEENLFPERRDDYFRYAYAWGRARIGVTEAWILRARPAAPRKPELVKVAIRQFGRVRPDWKDSEHSEWLFLGGWKAESEARLRAVDRILDAAASRGAAFRTIDAIVETPGMMRARVDFAEYLERSERLESESARGATWSPSAGPNDAN